MHARFAPVEHRFVYPVYTYALDLEELPALDREVRGFGYNRFNLAAIHDRDYLRGAGSIRDRLMRLLEARGCADGIARIEMVTMARFLNYVFNPVSFYYCYREDGSLRCVTAEVNNTFGDRHVYVLDKAEGEIGAWPVEFRQEKEFHVSPFNDMRGHYEMSFSELADTMRIAITLWRDGERVMTATISGESRPLDTENFRYTVTRHPVAAMLNFPLISWEAAKLYYRKHLPFHRRPYPSHPMTIGVRGPTRVQSACMRAMLKILGRVRGGRLRLTLPDGEVRELGDGSASRSHELRVRNFAFFSRTVLGGDVGFGESYTDKDWETDDLPALLRFLVRNAGALQPKKLGAAARIGDALLHAMRRNTIRGSRRNIEAHYDLGNDFYQTFLDPETMMYSCAMHESPEQPLAEAQKYRLRRLILLADIGATDHVLEIGCGWGGFAILAARETGCRVTGITISREQLAFARERVKEAGLEDLVDIRYCDYRELQGQFDKIVSIEMLEAVGHAYYGTFMRVCDRVLKPGGRVVLQVITIPDQRYDAYRRKPDWIQKYIFPGGMLPSLTELCRAMKRDSSLGVDELHNIGPHYPRTLRAWRDSFNANRERLLDMGYDEKFQRMWNYYLCYCEAGFAERVIHDLHLVLTRPGE